MHRAAGWTRTKWRIEVGADITEKLERTMERFFDRRQKQTKPRAVTHYVKVARRLLLSIRCIKAIRLAQLPLRSRITLNQRISLKFSKLVHIQFRERRNCPPPPINPCRSFIRSIRLFASISVVLFLIR